ASTRASTVSAVAASAKRRRANRPPCANASAPHAGPPPTSQSRVQKVRSRAPAVRDPTPFASAATTRDRPVPRAASFLHSVRPEQPGRNAAIVLPMVPESQGAGDVRMPAAPLFLRQASETAKHKRRNRLWGDQLLPQTGLQRVVAPRGRRPRATTVPRRFHCQSQRTLPPPQHVAKANPKALHLHSAPSQKGQTGSPRLRT